MNLFKRLHLHIQRVFAVSNDPEQGIIECSETINVKELEAKLAEFAEKEAPFGILAAEQKPTVLRPPKPGSKIDLTRMS